MRQNANFVPNFQQMRLSFGLSSVNDDFVYCRLQRYKCVNDPSELRCRYCWYLLPLAERYTAPNLRGLFHGGASVGLLRAVHKSVRAKRQPSGVYCRWAKMRRVISLWISDRVAYCAYINLSYKSTYTHSMLRGGVFLWSWRPPGA